MTDNTPEISVVVPVFNEAGTLRELHQRIVSTLEAEGRPFEIIAVDDGSSDDSLSVLAAIRGEDSRVRVLRLARNFGQTPALYAGFSQARGRYVAMIDADLQNYPEDIPRLVAKLEEGYDMVSGYRVARQDTVFRSWSSRLLNWWIGRITRQPLRDYGCALKAFRREMVERMNTFTHRSRYLPVDAAWLGGRVAELEVQHAERAEGESKYGVFKLIRTCFDLMTGITSAPLQMIGLMGWFFALVGFAMGLRVLWVRLTMGDINQMGTVVAAFFFLGGVQMIATGLMCEYVGRIFIEVQGKPYFVIHEELD